MSNISKYLDALIKEFSKLPGIGPKSASRLAFHLLKISGAEVEKFAAAIIELKRNITSCEICGGISDSNLCPICADESRNSGLLCVVEGQKDVLIIEKTGGFDGIYHVLGGVLSPLDGIGPDDLRIDALIGRCRNGMIKEIIIATNPTVEGDATALYIAKLLKDTDISVMRIAHGLPVGADLDFADSATLLKSIESRVMMRG